jgi:26S proteasome regulatory subunit T4
VDPLVYNMSHEDPGNIAYNEIGGLSEQIRELREVIELPLRNPELFQRVGITVCVCVCACVRVGGF